MLSLCKPRPDELRGDHLRRKALRAALMAALAALLCLPLYLSLGHIWQVVARQGGLIFILSAMGFGLLMVLPPFLSIGFALFALFCRIESSFAPRLRVRPRGDRLSIVAGLLLTIAPALAACYPPIHAILSGSIRYKFPATAIARELDPLGFWQGVAFWFMGAATLFIAAMIYWWPRLKRLRNKA